MSPVIRTLSALLAVSLASFAAGQSTLRPQPAARTYCDARTDVLSQPGSGTALHQITTSGSYVLTSNIVCPSGRTAISIAPSALSVVIDFNGFAIVGDPGLGALHAVECPPSPARRGLLELHGARIFLFGGDAISISSVQEVLVQDSIIDTCSGTGCEVVDVERIADIGNKVSRCVRGVHFTSVVITARRSSASHCVDGMELCAEDITLADSSVWACANDGIILDDACQNPASSRTGGWNLKEGVKVFDCGGDGVDARVSNGRKANLQVEALVAARCTQNGLRVSVTGAGAGGGPHVRVSSSSFAECGGSGIDLSSSADVDCAVDDVTFADCAVAGLRGAGGGPRATYDIKKIEGARCGAGALITCPGDLDIRVGSSCTLDCNTGFEFASGGHGKVNVQDISLTRCAGGGGSISASSSLEVECVRATFSDLGGSGLTCSSGGHGKVNVQDISMVRFAGNGLSVTTGGDCELKTYGMYLADGGNFGVAASGGGHGKVNVQDISMVRCASGGGSISYVGPCDASIEDSTFSSNGGHGLVVRGGAGGGAGGALRMSSCTLSENSGDGCQVDFSSGGGGSGGHGKVNVQDLHLRSNSGRGLLVSSASTSLSSVACVGSGSHGVQIVDADCDGVDCDSSSNGGDGMRASSSGGNSYMFRLERTALSSNSGRGLSISGYSAMTDTCAVSRNLLGGITSLSGSGTCGSGACRIASSTFSDNGVCAIDLQSSNGGAVSGCTISGTNIGLHVGDVSGSGCARGVSVTDCTLSDCPTGIVALAGARTLVVRNHVIGAGTAYSIAAGNLVGPVLTTSADLASIPNPHANYAQ